MTEKRWYQSKTVWTGIGGLIAAAGAFATGDMNLADAIQTALTAMIGIFLRTSVGR
jgi:hypothetical protein